MECKCGGTFKSKTDTFVIAWEQKLAIIAIVCNKCGAQRTLILKPKSWQDEVGCYDF
jgi:hypothetical protein